MSKTKGFLLAVAVAAMAFTFSCSSDDGGGDGDGLSSSNGGQSSSSLSSAGGSSSSVGEESSSSAGGGSSSGTGVALWSSCPVTEVSENSVTCGGETYPTVKIGVQTWFAKNLNYAGDDEDKKIGRCYRNLESSCATSGRLYNWPQANAVCPDGWHLPSNAEWRLIIDLAGGLRTAGDKLKSRNGWGNNNGGTNNYGFSAIPGSYGLGDGTFGIPSAGLSISGYWWTSTEGFNSGIAHNIEMTWIDGEVEMDYYAKSGEMSVRCVKDISRGSGEPVDYEGETYETVIIGDQTWFAKNLNYAGDDDENKIGRCYNDLETNCAIYGRLYNQQEAMAACPLDWHLPTKAEWDALATTVGIVSGIVNGSNIAGTKLKATSGWKAHEENGNGTDDFGFSALPGGRNNYGVDGFFDIGEIGRWWSATNISGNNLIAHYYYMTYFEGNLVNNSIAKTSLHSVRCLRD